MTVNKEYFAVGDAVAYFTVDKIPATGNERKQCYLSLGKRELEHYGYMGNYGVWNAVKGYYDVGTYYDLTDSPSNNLYVTTNGVPMVYDHTNKIITYLDDSCVTVKQIDNWTKQFVINPKTISVGHLGLNGQVFAFSYEPDIKTIFFLVYEGGKFYVIAGTAFALGDKLEIDYNGDRSDLSQFYFCNSKSNIVLITPEKTYTFNKVEYSTDGEGTSSTTSNLTKQIDYNPAHAIYEAITSPVWGLGKPPSCIDMQSFMHCADVLYDEDFGISFVYEGSDKIADFINEVCDTIGANLRFNRRTGLIELKLLRDDYKLEDLPLIDVNNITELGEIKRTCINNCINQVTLTYRNYKNGSDSSVVIQDIGLIQMSGQINNADVSHKYICWEDTALQIAERELASLSSQFLSVEVKSNSVGFDLNIGDCVKLNFPEVGIDNVPFRIIKISYGDSKTQEVSMTLSQDKYSFNLNTTLASNPTESGSSGNETSIGSIKDIGLIEAPYFALYKNDNSINNTLINDTGYAKAMLMPSKYGATDINQAGVFTSFDASTYSFVGLVPEFTPSFRVAQLLDEKSTEVYIDSTYNLSALSISSVAVVDNEIVAITNHDQKSNKLTIVRGAFDTIPTSHEVGAKCFVFDYDNGEYFLNDTYEDGEQLSVRVCECDNYGSANIGNANTATLSFASRAYRPYPVANLNYSGAYLTSSSTIRHEYNVTLSFCTRNRLTQIYDFVTSWYEKNNIQMEEGSTINVTYYTLTGHKLRTIENIPFTTKSNSNNESWCDYVFKLPYDVEKSCKMAFTVKRGDYESLYDPTFTFTSIRDITMSITSSYSYSSSKKDTIMLSIDINYPVSFSIDENGDCYITLEDDFNTEFYLEEEYLYRKYKD